jgi:ribonuclease HI
METLACRDGVALAAEIGVQRVQVETDSQKLVKLWEAANI